MRGQIAKENVANIIKNAFGDNYVGEFDKKHYVWADDGGQKIQVSIALTCPKVLRGVEDNTPKALNFDDDDPAAADNANFKPADISAEENDTLEKLMQKLGL